ncbi:hypothetical protein [Clavibacter michiganensis]|uniref:hypothetical protein n=2 Tax=Clavibacter michiganensis TaxID=28447 RepID=UPI002930DD1B|nr:hypothetical protein [Clavibacter michiganensis]
MMATANLRASHPTRTGGRYEYLAAWATGRLLAALTYAIVAIMGIDPLAPGGLTAIGVLLLLLVVGILGQSYLRRRAWQWVPMRAPADREPAGLFWASAATDAALPVLTALAVFSFTDDLAYQASAAVVMALGLGLVSASPLSYGDRREWVARGLQLIALAIAASLLAAPAWLWLLPVVAVGGAVQLAVRVALR